MVGSFADLQTMCELAQEDLPMEMENWPLIETPPLTPGSPPADPPAVKANQGLHRSSRQRKSPDQYGVDNY